MVPRVNLSTSMQKAVVNTAKRMNHNNASPPRITGPLSMFPLFKGSTSPTFIARNPNEFYRDKFNKETFKGVTFKGQAELPDLPVPELNKTIQLYLQSIKPYCGGNPQILETQEKLCNDFLTNEGPVLQKRLEEFANGKKNWLSEFWDKQAYLDVEDPLSPYVSYFYSHKNLPKTLSNIQKDPLLKSTALITILVRFIEALKNESIPSEVIRGNSFCMDGFKYMFNNSRVPNLNDEGDTNIFYSIFENNFATIMYNGNFYILKTHYENNNPMEPNDIWKQLYNIVSQNFGTEPNQIGTLTSLPRNLWKKTYQKMISNNPVNNSSFEKIHKSSFVLCLDLDSNPVTLEEKSRNCWYGNSTNRFFDKPLQFFVAGNGASGFLAEHSKMDGTPTLFLNDYLCAEMNKINEPDFINSIFSIHHNSAEIKQQDEGPSNNNVKPLPFMITPDVEDTISQSKTIFKNNTQEQDLKVWHYTGYGKDFIKQQKMSPDAYIQHVIQLAIFKYLKKQLPTYEAASTRRFYHGRTEAGRVVSTESQKFVQMWDNPNFTIHEKVDQLKTSLIYHSNYLKLASAGHAIDRHFLGLRNMVKRDENIPAIFNNDLFNYSKTWYISTSQLTSEHFDGYGWSEVNDNGLGLAYMVNKKWMHVNITTKSSKSGFDVNRLHYYLTCAADEISEALTKVENDNNNKAKL